MHAETVCVNGAGGINNPEAMSQPEAGCGAVRSAIRNNRWYGRVPIAIILAAAIGILVLFTAGIVFAVGVRLAQKNTFDLLSTNSYQAVTADVDQIEQYLQPAESQAGYIADLIHRGEVDLADRATFGTLLTGSLAAAPQISAVVFIDVYLESFAASRDPVSGLTRTSTIDNAADTIVQANMDASEQGPLWLPPIWRDGVEKTFLSYATPIVLDNEYVGSIIAVVSLDRLSDFISMEGLETAGNRFILYGRDYILAHWLMVDGYLGRSDESPLPRLDRFGDPVMSSMWQTDNRRELRLNVKEGIEGHSVEIAGNVYVFVYQSIGGYGQQPLLVGTYFQASDRPAAIERIKAALITGLIALFLSLIAAIYLGRRIARPIVKFSSAAGRIRDLDVSKIEELPGSVFRELNDQSMAFNAMLRALRWFEFYVPKKIVEQLIRQGEINDSLSDVREVTVMFTDVVGFSTVSEGMLAEEVAAFVNHHFSLVVKCIEAEEGTVDKFIGDAVMAFWQDASAEEPEQPNSAERACRAAIAVAESIRLDNRKRRLSNDPPVGIRIGIHTGVATVGNIGAPGRLNYTIIGDTVNIGQRLEQLGKDIYPSGTDVSILISATTAQILSADFSPISAGNYKLNGRVEAIDVYKIE